MADELAITDRIRKRCKITEGFFYISAEVILRNLPNLPK
jgi:hypothetical protein